jgi:hypothetical protein
MNVQNNRAAKNLLKARMIGAASIAAVVLAGVAGATPAMADGWYGNRPYAQNIQANKNLMRNVGLGLGVAAVVEATQGQRNDAVILGTGAILAGAQVVHDQQVQCNDHDRFVRFDHRDHDRRDCR